MPEYWAIKTTGRSDGKDYWPLFVVEGVIAIGWHEIDPGQNAGHAQRMIKMFKGIATGDHVLICRGYSGNQKQDVYTYGFADVKGPFVDDSASNWWKFKHRANIYCFVERRVQIDLLRKTLKMGSMRKTLHKIHEQEGFQQLKSQLCKQQRESQRG